MSQRAVESLLGRLVTDRAFRRRFYEEPAGSCLQESIEVTIRELKALLALDQAHIEAFTKRLDPTIIRAAVQVGEQLTRPARRSTTASSARLGGAK